MPRAASAPIFPRPTQRAGTRTSSPVALSRALAHAAGEVAAVIGGESLALRKPLDSLGTVDPLRAQVHEMLYGTLRRYGEGDAILGQLVDRPLDLPVRALLLVALYRLCSAPAAAHTLVDQAVDAAAMTDARRAGGLINAVLRNFLRQRDPILNRIAADASVRWAHPAWWLSRLQNAYPTDWQGIAAAANQLPPTSLRVNQRQRTRADCLAHFAAAGVNASAVPDCPQAIRLQGAGRIDRLPGYDSGDFSVQDQGAQRAAPLLDARSNHRVLDACAAPGGKSTHLLELADIELTALDLDPYRCSQIEENLARLRLANPRVRVVAGDAGQSSGWWDGQLFDRILADVPCTASGIVRRHPDAKWLRRDQDVDRFALQQTRILQALWPLLAVGGKLLYATCSVFPEENEDIVSAFCAARPDAAICLREQWLPNPDHDGFFYALLEKSAV